MKATQDRIGRGEVTTPGTLRRHMLRFNDNRCHAESCAWDFNKVSVTVEVHHIDGDPNNNRPENLTLLCPNCHSLTETFKAKNKGKGRTKRMLRYAEGLSY